MLNWLFRYDEESGKLYRTKEATGKVLSPEREIIAVNSSGYLQVGIRDSNGLLKLFQVHQLIYYMISGLEPLSIVDHRVGNKTNNRFDNLRLDTESENQRNKGMQSNNTSGITGVYWNKKYSKWQAQSCDNTGKQKFLGYFNNITEAADVVQTYRNNIGTYTERHGT